MKINSIYQRFEFYPRNELKIKSYFGQSIASIPINLSFFQEAFPGRSDRERTLDREQGWRDISVSGLPGDRGQIRSVICRVNIVVLERLVNEDISLRGQRLIRLARNGTSETLTAMVEQGLFIKETDRYQAIKVAVQRGDSNILTLILASGPITYNLRYQAILEAIRSDRLEIVRLLLQQRNSIQRFFNISVISKWDRGNAIILAAENNNLEIVRLLLSDGPIGVDCRSIAARHANERGYRQIFNCLSSNGYGSILILLEDLPAASLAGPRIHVLPEEFATNPELFLRNLAHDGLPSGITFMNPDGTAQPGIDAGGLTKQFICQLCEHLILKQVIKRDSLRFPRSSKPDLTPYTQLGKLLSHIDQANATRRDHLLVGEIFDPRTYGLLQILAEPQNATESPELRKDRELLAIANTTVTSDSQLIVDFLKNPAPLESDIAALKQYYSGKSMSLPEGLTLESLKATLFQDLLIDKSHSTLSAILEGLSASLKGKILVQGSGIAKSLQGGIDKRLLTKFVCNSESIAVRQKLRWIKQKIQQELAYPEKPWIKRFLKSVTSQSVIPIGNIEIRESSDTMCHAHTCFNRLDLPRNVTSKDLFFERLELLMSEEGFGLT